MNPRIEAQIQTLGAKCKDGKLDLTLKEIMCKL